MADKLIMYISIYNIYSSVHVRILFQLLEISINLPLIKLYILNLKIYNYTNYIIYLFIYISFNRLWK